jgi:ligand-binding sensor protein
MTLEDIQPLDKWADLERDIYDKSGLDTSVYGPDGMSITDFKKWANSFCPAVKNTKAGLGFICAAANQNMAREASKTKKTFIGECDAGLMKMVVPIFIGQEFIGAVGACGKFLEGSEIESFLVNKITGIEENEIERPEDLVVKTVANRSKLKVFIIQNIDRKIPFEDIANAKGVEVKNIISEVEAIVNSGTRLNIDYYINNVLDQEHQEEVWIDLWVTKFSIITSVFFPLLVHLNLGN